MVGVRGFEPRASWTRTKRDTKLRHTPMDTVEYYSDFKRNCQAENYRFPFINKFTKPSAHPLDAGGRAVIHYKRPYD